MSSTIGPTITVRAYTDSVSADLADELVLLNVRNGEYYGLSAVGAFIWSMIQEPRPVRTIHDRLVEEYPAVEPERLERDLTALLEQLAAAGLIETSAASPA